MINKIKISIIMCAYNSEKFIEASIMSILTQTFSNFELIIINDGSTDGTATIINKFSKTDKRIKQINFKKNIGVYVRRNIGINLAKGKYLAFMDSDDISLPKRLEIQYNYLQQNPEFYLIGSSYEIIDKNNEHIRNEIAITGFPTIKNILPEKMLFLTSSLMLRNDKKNKFRVKFIYAGDYDFVLLLLSKGYKMNNLPDILVKYRININSITGSKRSIQRRFSDKCKEFYAMRKKREEDDYNKWNNNDIFDSNNETESANNLEDLVHASYYINDFTQCRKYIKEYFIKFGFKFSLFCHYFASYFHLNNRLTILFAHIKTFIRK